MPLDLSGWVTPAQTFAPLYKIGDDLQRNAEMEQRQKELELNNQFKQSSRNAATANFLKSYLDPSKFFSGSPEGGAITSALEATKQKAFGLASQGLDPSAIAFAISPDVEKLSKMSQSLKEIEAKKKEHLDFIKTNKDLGIDPTKYAEAFDKAAYFDDKGAIKDLSNLDASQNFDQAALQNPSVYNNSALDSWIGKSPMQNYNQKDKYTTRAGAVKERNLDLGYQGFMQPERDANGSITGFVPKYNEAIDEDAKLVHEFNTDNGKVKAPVRLLADDVYETLPTGYLAKNKAEVANYVSQHPELKMNSQQAETLSKALAYDDINNNQNLKKKIAPTQSDKEAPIRSYSFYNGSAVPPSQVPQTVDAYSNLYKTALDHLDKSKYNKPYVPMNSIESTTRQVLLDIARDTFNDKDLGVGDMYVQVLGDGTLNLVGVHSKLSLKIDPASINVPVNKALLGLAGSKQKTEAQRGINVAPSKVNPVKTVQHYDINDPKNWKQEGNDFRFADGSLYKLNSKTGKMDKIK